MQAHRLHIKIAELNTHSDGVQFFLMRWEIKRRNKLRTRRSCTLSHFSNANFEKFLMTAISIKVAQLKSFGWKTTGILQYFYILFWSWKTRGSFFLFFLKFVFKKKHWRGGLKVTRAETGNDFFFFGLRLWCVVNNKSFIFTILYWSVVKCKHICWWSFECGLPILVWSSAATFVFSWFYLCGLLMQLMWSASSSCVVYRSCDML